jgi:glycosyltransferase involved in cell wall biosynthesis
MLASPSVRVLGIDAANIRGGGGVTHLVELLRAADPMAHGFSKVIVWSGARTLDRIEDRPWLEKIHLPTLDRGLARRTIWQRFRLSAAARAAGCHVLFAPGGSYAGSFRPVVSFSQNLLPFDWREARRFGWDPMTLKLAALRIVQGHTFRRADGLICLTQHARDVVLKAIKTRRGPTTVIAHGIDRRFVRTPREQRPIGEYSPARPFRLLYVSVVNVYKHQWHVAEAVAQLRASGWPVVLDLVGPAYPPALERLRETLERVDPSGEVVHYAGPVAHEELHDRYAQADLFVFASSCETFGQILTEAMSAGLPVACASQPSLRELLGNGGVYFDPENPSDIARKISGLMASADERRRLADQSFARAQAFSWTRCADETFAFLSEVAMQPPSRRDQSC